MTEENKIAVPDIPRISIYPSLRGEPMDLQWVAWFQEFQRVYADPFAGLLASRIIATDANGLIESVTNLANWIAGTTNEIDITDNGDGTISIGIVDPLIVSKGGTGLATITDHAIILGSGTGAVTPLGVAANGQIPIGSAGSDPVLATLLDSNLVNTDVGAGSITFNDDELEFYIQAVA